MFAYVWLLLVLWLVPSISMSALIEHEIVSGPGYSVSVVEDDIAHTWVNVNVKNNTDTPIFVYGEVDKKKFKENDVSVTLNNIPLIQVTRKGETIWLPVGEFSFGVSQDVKKDKGKKQKNKNEGSKDD